MDIRILPARSLGDLRKFIESQPPEYLKFFGSTDPIGLMKINSLCFIFYDEKIIGIIGYRFKEKYFIEKFNRKFWLLTMIDFEFRGKGIATMATRMFLNQLPEEITEIYSGISRDNKASIRVKEKLGFSEAGGNFKTVVYKLCL